MIRMICYDITDSKVRTSLAKLLEYQGFERIQYSVFVGKVPPGRWEKCWEALGNFYEKRCQETDRVYCHVIEKDHFGKMSILGHGPNSAWILHELEVLFV